VVGFKLAIVVWGHAAICSHEASPTNVRVERFTSSMGKDAWTCARVLRGCVLEERSAQGMPSVPCRQAIGAEKALQHCAIGDGECSLR
jgi:hypothetical protein